MNRSTFYTLNSFLILLCLLSGASHASLSAVKANSNKSNLLASSQNVVAINWQIATTASHTQGVVSSSPAEIYDPATGNLLLTVGGTLGKSGAGPFTLSESLTVTARSVQLWLDTGIRRVVLRRTFQEQVSSGAPTIGEIAFTLASNPLSLSRDGASELTIQSLKISLNDDDKRNQSSIKIVELNGALQPVLTIAYAGTGLLEGKWQIAEPDSTQGLALFRTLSIVRQALVKTQQSEISGPVLPTNRSGKYLLRFCVTDQNQTETNTLDNSNCTNPALNVQAVYQVMPNSAPIASMEVHSPLQETVSTSSPFSWDAASGAVIYKLDIFESLNNRMQLVTGILLPGSYTQTTLTELMQSKLQKGARYVWQISAINEAGNVIAQSKRYQFGYQP